MQSSADISAEIYFTDFFEVAPQVLEEYGAFNISLINDLQLFIDPFLLFNSEEAKYKRLHEQMIDYLRFLRDKSVSGRIEEGLLQSWFTFSEVKQNWLGFSASGNSGSGLGLQFARALNRNLTAFFTDFGHERVTEGSHLEKLTLIESGVGRDDVSDFTTNLIKNFLLDYTQAFAQRHIRTELRRRIAVEKVRFNYSTQVWESKSFDLPWDGEDYVLLTPKNILTKDENWINRNGLVRDYNDIVQSVEDSQLRAQINNETLAEYYIRTHDHLVPDEVEIWEYEEDAGEVIIWKKAVRENPLKNALDVASRLPEHEQDAVAKWLMAELASEEGWDERFAGTQDALSVLAREASEEHERGETKELDPGSL
jgi:hypothetical protein